MNKDNPYPITLTHLCLLITTIEYSAQHPVTVMLDIIRNSKVEALGYQIDTASFDAVITDLAGLEVTKNDSQ